MSVIDELRNHFSELTLSEQKAASYILDHIEDLLSVSLTDLASLSGSSNSAIIRLCQKLGYKGYSEFKFAFRRQLLSNEVSKPDISADPMQQLLNVYIDYINQIPASLSKDELYAIASCIAGARNRCIWGINRTFLPASQLSMRLGRIGYLSITSNDGVSMMDQASTLSSGDVLILYTLKGRGSSAYSSLLETANRNGAITILVTMTPNLPLAKYADYTVTLPCISRNNTNHFYEDQIILFLFNELLLTQISKL